ncbi:MAG: hypothetical protein ACOYB2_02980 [Limnohabitans sp.]
MAHVPQALIIRRITKDEAARAFMACAGLDPEGKETPEHAAQAGECFAVAGKGGEVALSVAFRGGVAWVMAAAGGGDRMAGPTLEAIERLAKAHDCFVIAFQTMRKGLKRVAVGMGYETISNIGPGWKLEKQL